MYRPMLPIRENNVLRNSALYCSTEGFCSDLVYVSDDLPHVGVHPQWEEEHTAELAEYQ